MIVNIACHTYRPSRMSAPHNSEVAPHSIGVEIHLFYAHLLARPQASPLRLRAHHEHLSTRSRGGGGSTINRCHFRYARRQTEPDAVITSSPDPVRAPYRHPTAHASRTQENAHARALLTQTRYSASSTLPPLSLTACSAVPWRAFRFDIVGFLLLRSPAAWAAV